MNRPTPDRRRHNEKAAQSVIPVAAVLEGVHSCFAVTRTESTSQGAGGCTTMPCSRRTIDLLRRGKLEAAQETGNNKKAAIQDADRIPVSQFCGIE